MTGTAMGTAVRGGGRNLLRAGPVLALLLAVSPAGGQEAAASLEPGHPPPASSPEAGALFRVPAENQAVYERTPPVYHRKGEELVRRTGKECRDCHVPAYYPQKDFFGWEARKKWLAHWGLFSVALFFTFVGLYSTVSIWSLGKRPSLHRSVHWPSALGALFRNGILGERIWRQSRLRWAVFVLVSMAFLALAAVFALLMVNRFLLPPALALGKPLVLALEFLADFFGGCIVAGTLLALGRRIPGRRESVKIDVEDLVILLLLLGTVLTGFFLEASRLAVVAPAPETWASFVGALGALALRQVDLPWTVIRFYVWNLHAVLVFGLLAYLPFSKLFHLLAAPVTIAATASEAHYKQRR